jgi:hypothetical protein
VSYHNKFQLHLHSLARRLSPSWRTRSAIPDAPARERPSILTRRVEGEQERHRRYRTVERPFPSSLRSEDPPPKAQEPHRLPPHNEKYRTAARPLTRHTGLDPVSQPARAKSVSEANDTVSTTKCEVHLHYFSLRNDSGRKFSPWSVS